LQKLDCGRVGERLFLLTLSAGFDATITHCLEAQRHGPINRLSFIGPIYRSIREYDFPQLRITARRDGIAPKSVGGTVEYVSRWCFIQNLPGYALLLNFTPRADARDGLLDFCLFERPGFLNGLFFIYRVLLGRHRLLKDCHVGRSPAIHVECLDPSKTVSVQIDGEDAGTLPIDVEVVPNRVTFIVP
jgi:diacylglycerol kinase family enzyme